MKLLSVLLLLATVCLAATPAKEKAFIDAYKKAVETNNEAGLTALLYTKGSDPQALEFYKLMLTSNLGSQVTSIQLVALTDADKSRLAKSPAPDGKPMKMVIPPTKKLVVKLVKKDNNGSVTSDSEVYVAEFNGDLYIPVPAKN